MTENEEIQRIKKMAAKEEIAHGDFEIDKGIPFHPSVDIRNEVLLLGFRIRDKERKAKNLYAIVKNDRLRLSMEDNFKIGKQEYYIETRNRLLEPLNERWNFEKLKELTDRPFGKPKGVFGMMKELIKKYIELMDERDYDLAVAWSIGTYFFRIFWSYPFLNPKGPKKSGKTQFLDVLNNICFNAKKARPTLAALCDTVDSLRGTYLIDQADCLWREGKEEILDILTDSYKREGGKRRIVELPKDGSRRVTESETYSPKAFASITELPEDLRDRCLIIPIIKSSHNFPEPSEENEDWRSIRDLCYQLLIAGYKEVEEIYQSLKKKYRESSELTGRILDLWIPLETMLIFLGVPSQEIDGVRKRYCSLYGYAEYEPSEFEEKVVIAILDQFQEEEEVILGSKEISEKLYPNEVIADPEELKNRPVRVGLTIKKFNLSSDKMPRTKGGVRYKFTKEKVEKVYRRYFKSEGEPTQPYTKKENREIPE